MTAQPLQAVVFDFDGVLFDSEPLHQQALQALGSALGYPVSDQAYHQTLIAFDDRDAMRWIAGRAGWTPEKAEAALPGWMRDKQLAVEDAVREYGVPAVPGALELIDACRGSGLPIAIASGATRRDIAAILDKAGRSDAFDVVVTADDVARSKPDPESYARAVRKLAERFPDHDIAPAGCAAIEDTAGGARSAVDAGLAVVGVTTTGPAEALRAAGAVDVCDGPHQIDVERLVRAVAGR